MSKVSLFQNFRRWETESECKRNFSNPFFIPSLILLLNLKKWWTHHSYITWFSYLFIPFYNVCLYTIICQQYTFAVHIFCQKREKKIVMANHCMIRIELEQNKYKLINFAFQFIDNWQLSLAVQSAMGYELLLCICVYILGRLTSINITCVEDSLFCILLF